MATIDVYATGRSLTFLPSERAKRIVLEQPHWWSHRIDFTRDVAVDRLIASSLELSPDYVLNHCRWVASEIPSDRWVRKEKSC